jgi:hypothetical protein
MFAGSMSVNLNSRSASGRVSRMWVPRRIMAGAIEGLAGMLAPSRARLQAQNTLSLDFLRQFDPSRTRLRFESQPRSAALRERDATPGTGATQNSPISPARSDGVRIATQSAEPRLEDTDAATDREIEPSDRRSWPGQA